jgi:adenylate cyclase
VLPFYNLSGDPEQDYFSDGLSEEIITTLSKVPGLFVIARNSSFMYKGKLVKAQQVSEELGVRYVLDGSVRKSGNQLRITTQLIDAITGRHLWAERYDRKLEDIFAIQDEITIKILSALRVKLKGGQWIPESGTDNLQAYMKTLEGAGYFYESKYTEALKHFEEARTLDPQWVNTYQWLSAVHLMNVWFGPSMTKANSLNKALEYAEECKDLDKSIDVCPRILGHVYLLKRDYDKAISEGKRAVELNPNSPTSAASLSLTLRSVGRYEDALRELERARRLDPKDNRSAIYHLCATYNLMRRHEEAIATCNKVIEVYPKNLSAYIQLVVAYSSLERMDEARAAAFEIKKIDPNFSVEQFAKTLPYKKKADKYLVANSLLKAGLE